MSEGAVVDEVDSEGLPEEVRKYIIMKSEEQM